MNRNILIAAILATLALAGCSSLSHSGAGATAQSEARPFPAVTDQGKF